MRVPRQYWEKRTVTNSEQGNSLLSLYPFFFILKTWHEKKELYFYEITSFTPNGHLLGGFFFLLWSVWPVIYLMVLLESAGVMGFAGKAPFVQQSGRSRTKATLRSWLNRTSARLSPTCSVSLPDLQRNIVLLLHLYLSLLLFWCFFFSTWWALFSCEAPFLRFRVRKLLAPPRNSWFTMCLKQMNAGLVHLFCTFFCLWHSRQILDDSPLSLTFSLFPFKKT